MSEVILQKSSYHMFLGLHGLNRTIRQVALSRTKTHEIEMNLTTKTQAAIGMLRMPNSGHGMPSLPGQEPQQALYQNTPESHTPLLEQKHFAFINGAKPETIAKILESEETETIALVLSCLDSNKTSVILNLLPKTRQAEIVLTMSKTDFIDTTKIKSSEEKLKNKLESLVEGKLHTIEMLSRINSNARDTILNFIKEKDPELAGRLEAEIFKFEDLATLTPEEVNLILAGINHEEISIALRGIPQEFADTVIKALPKEAQKALRQWIGLGHPQPVIKIEEMRSKIVEAARKLEQEGRISRHISPSGREAFGEVV